MARCDWNETNIQRGNLIELEFKEDWSAFGDAKALYSAGPPSSSRCCWVFWASALAQTRVLRSPVHWCTTAHLHSTITEWEPVLPMPSSSQIKPLLLGGLLGSNIKLDGFNLRQRCRRNFQTDRSSAKFDSNMMKNFIRCNWQEFIIFNTWHQFG